MRSRILACLSAAWWMVVLAFAHQRKLLETRKMVLNCTLNNQPVCCGIMDPEHKPGYPRVRESKLHHDDHSRCGITKKYVPSPYEQRHINLAASWKDLPHDQIRQRLVAAFVEDIPHSAAWLARVQEHMKGPADQRATDEDWKYLSYFNHTKTCIHTQDKTQVVTSWIEWIEPISIHMRHPFGFTGCVLPELMTYISESAKYMDPLNIENIDYVLFKAGKYLQDTVHVHQHAATAVPKYFFFDAGANKFLTGMAVFLCAYQQRGIIFDDIFGWEYVKVNHDQYWADVPSLITPIYHFYNVPVVADNHTTHSVPRIIKEIAREHDFVSFKLDIDTPSVEIPIAQQLRMNPELFNIVDEFFFELHFQCEITTKCGWQWPPDVVEGLRMDRITAMNLFQEIRKLGVRAHVWP